MAVSAAYASSILIAALGAFRKRATLARLGFSDLSGAANVAGEGDEFRITKRERPGDPNDASMAAAHDAALVTPGAHKIPIQVDHWKEYHFDVSDRDAAAYDLGTTFTGPAQDYGAALADYMERQLFASLAGGSGFATGTQGTNPFGANIDDIIAARKALIKRDAYDASGTVLFINPDMEENLLKRDEFTRADFRGDPGVLTGMTGVLGRKFGVTLVMSNNIPDVARGGAGNLAANGAALKGALTLAVDGVTTGINRGELLTVDSVTYAVNKGFTGTSGIVELDRPLEAAVADNAAVTRGVTDHPGFMLNPYALGVIMRPAAPPLGAGADGPVSLTDPETGFSLSLEAARIKHGTRYFISALWGSRVIEPEAVERLHG